MQVGRGRLLLPREHTRDVMFVVLCLHRTAFAQRRSSEIMDNEELQTLWSRLEDKNTPPVDPDSEEQVCVCVGGGGGGKVRGGMV